ncbi:MAG: aminotransferase class I/II-fold pyridoxal phosphate-dependent enzyme [Bdellovibrionota bacterium]
MNSLKNAYCRLQEDYENKGNTKDWLTDTTYSEFLKLKSNKIYNHEQIYDLSMINPDLPPHIFLLDKLLEASMKKENHRYAVSRGVFKLRQAFSYKYKNSFDAILDPASEVCVTMASKDAVSSLLISNFEKGQKALLPDPVYPAHLSAVRIAGLIPCFYNQGNEETMQQEISSIIDREKISIIFLNFPNNPTGRVVSKEFYQGLYYIIKDKNIVVYNDYAYGEMLYNNAKCPSILSIDGFKNYAVESYTFSKAYNVPGWRVGAIMGNKDIISKISNIKSYLDYGLFLAIQSAATSVLTSTQDLLKDTLETYNERLTYFCTELQKLGWEVKKPNTGACVWAKLPQHLRIGNSYESACQILNKVNICITPGEQYSQSSKDHMRFALVRPINILEKVIEGLAKL